MQNFIYVECPCGRTLRARREQMGTTVRCWNCGTHVVVPRHGEGGRLARALGQGVREALSPQNVALAAAAALAGTALMYVPHIGVWLFAMLVVAGAWVFQDLIQESASVWSADDERGRPRWRELGIRALLSLLGATAVLAPIVIRNGGGAVPRGRALGSPWAVLFACLVWWLVLPLLLTFANARDRNGPVRLRQVCATFLARPRGTAATLLLVPLGLLAVELGLVFLAVEQAQFPLLFNNAFPPPRIAYDQLQFQMLYRFDDCEWKVPFANNGMQLVPVYLSALGRGYTMLAGVPGSLTLRYPRSDPSVYQSTMFAFLALRLAFSALGLTGAVMVLGAQARCLGRLVAAGVEADIAASARTGLTVIPSLHTATGASNPVSSLPPRGAGDRMPIPPVEPDVAASARTGLIPIPTEWSRPSPAPIVPPPLDRDPAPSIDPAAAASARTGLIPIPTAWASPAPAPIPPPPAESATRTVLIIDDEATCAQALGRVLADLGFSVSIAVNGRDGLALAAAMRPALIILDLLLPDRSGFDICRALRSDSATQNIPILMLSARDDATDEVTGLEQGADDYVAKPYVVEVLIARIRKQLRGSANGKGTGRGDGTRVNGLHLMGPARS